MNYSHAKIDVLLADREPVELPPFDPVVDLDDEPGPPREMADRLARYALETGVSLAELTAQYERMVSRVGDVLGEFADAAGYSSEFQYRPIPSRRWRPSLWHPGRATKTKQTKHEKNRTRELAIAEEQAKLEYRRKKRQEERERQCALAIEWRKSVAHDLGQAKRREEIDARIAKEISDRKAQAAIDRARNKRNTILRKWRARMACKRNNETRLDGYRQLAIAIRTARSCAVSKVRGEVIAQTEKYRLQGRKGWEIGTGKNFLSFERNKIRAANARAAVDASINMMMP